jgi:phosphoribosylcarboxyaminoimidazole (NCAIR) mutase
MILDFLKGLLHFTVDFLVIGVVLKIIVAHWIAQHIMQYSEKVFNSSERNLAIWLHYQANAGGKAHLTGSVLHCTDGKCSIFRNA